MELRVTEVGEDRRELVVHGVDQVDAAGEALEPVPGVRQRLRVPVESDEDDLRMPLEHRLGVPAEAQREVDVHRCGPVEGGSEQLEAALEQHRHVRAAKLPHVDPHRPALPRAPPGRLFATGVRSSSVPPDPHPLVPVATGRAALDTRLAPGKRRQERERLEISQYGGSDVRTASAAGR
ncbi:hypothetical protein Asp14428_25360 [Actinoplanes sp. NBRC 14428]|nr:hypothetical protein Asp14428_25360 [Actinoplanes sp. NBRC 14428]